VWSRTLGESTAQRTAEKDLVLVKVWSGRYAGEKKDGLWKVAERSSVSGTEIGDSVLSHGCCGISTARAFL
jgi:hypothetical protein